MYIWTGYKNSGKVKLCESCCSLPSIYTLFQESCIKPCVDELCFIFESASSRLSTELPSEKSEIKIKP